MENIITENYSLMNGDCIDLIKTVKDKSIDLILCDLPYGTLSGGYRGHKAKWDFPIDLDELFKEYKRVITEQGIICLFGVQPFTSDLIECGKDIYRYSWIWKKETPTGFLNANYKPLSITEDIAVFSFGSVGSRSKNPIKYNPQGVREINRVKRNNPKSKFREHTGMNSMNNVLNSDKEYTQKFENYPTTILEFPRDKEHYHPTQKPVKLLEYLIKTYTDPGMTVLDNTMGSGSTGVACMATNRKFIGMELDEKFFKISSDRISEESKKNKLNFQQN